jgi:hypothetical protein
MEAPNFGTALEWSKRPGDPADKRVLSLVEEDCRPGKQLSIPVEGGRCYPHGISPSVNEASPHSAVLACDYFGLLPPMER